MSLAKQLKAYNDFQDKLIRFMNTSTGRDKVNRLVQFLAKFLQWYTTKKGYHKDVVDRWKNLTSAVASSRKLFQIGKSQEFMRALSKASDIKDVPIKYLTMLKSLSWSFWMSNDALTWVHAAGIWKVEKINDVAKRASQFWLAGLVFSILAHVYRLRQNSENLERAKGKADESSKEQTRDLLTQRNHILYNLLQDSLDAVLPASNLGYVTVDDGIFSLVGVTTSIMGARSHW
ncbi:peroxisomal biogenesis factor 11 [Gonapodya prolifera JEL478]|uniref:Peroxisomal biogenesis factor 11 n=1 Tax=Gonapodya prolifera (strain JEL478) TaxID=1344416 RepID=A0A139AZC5_GONPJ|nr:peroxisomal biogenesis factor 11 [Gonapodya prolifera JEL478]|eukprot:KXS22069.1 peroxisomal biogenesis factor 11 [Gonapodya prolifera JEL478]